MTLVRCGREQSISLVSSITPRGYDLAARKISAREVASDIETGLSNEEIGKKYNLSEKDTRRLFEKLVSADLMTGEEHDRRIACLVRSADSRDGNGRRAVRKLAATTLPETPLARTQLLERFECDDKAGSAVSGRDIEPVQPEPHSDPTVKDIHKDAGPTPAEFIDVSKQGQNQWWRYAVSILFILFFSNLMWGIVTAVLGTRLDKSTGDFVGADTLGNYVLMHIGFLCYLVTFLLAVRFEHKRPILSLITRNQSIDWKKMGKSFGVFSALLSLVLIGDYLLAPETFEFSLNPDRFLLFAPVALILTPMQTTTEEIFFRGYLLQMTAFLTRNRFVLVFISGVLFMLPHLVNPETALGFLPVSLTYFAIGAFLTLVTLKGNGLESALGLHAANNLFALLVVNHANSSMKTESIFFCSSLDPVGSLVSFCIIAPVFYVLIFGNVPLFSRIIDKCRDSVRC